ncbi:hypothetical protein BDM02DRAFT_991187 [Thelephora ganbajun]|uniref:Uncharacterized protein n=1 Tax=Thelephora ganbajun TaxID=370292 RepID=A0ACB6Z459_THEGA|nr:hypothetical protein BDM02DRAFT_991187 [Thelephora ganbajun]
MRHQRDTLNVYHGSLDGARICAKRVRVYIQGGPQKIFCQEAVMWKRLTHPNILPLLGVTITPLQLISNWVPDGNLSEYIKDNSDADRLALMSDVAKGLCYLHSCNVIHGDLKGLRSWTHRGISASLRSLKTRILQQGIRYFLFRDGHDRSTHG